jgi:hypothetical protein
MRQAIRRPSTILAPNGKPAATFLYPTPRFNLRQYKPRFWLSASTKANVGEYDRWELVNYSRQLFAQIGNLSTAIKEKNSWAFGDAWDAHYAGRNPAWGQEAEEFLRNQFYPMCNIRGPQFDLKTSLAVSGQMWDIDGDDVMVMTQSANGFPLLAFYSSTRIGQTATGPRGSMQENSTVQGGQFSGAKIFDGIILDRNDRMIGLRLTSEDGTWTDVASYNCDLAYLPDWHDQARGIPRIATSLLRWMDLQDIDDFLRRGMKRAASIGLKFKKEEGEAGLGNEVITVEEDTLVPAGAGTPLNTDPQIAYEEIEGGEMYYLSSTTGEEIDALKYENPHPNAEAFIERVVREAVASVGWLLELLDLSKTGRAPTRLACDLANQSIWKQQRAAQRRAKRAISYAIAKGMKEDFVSKNQDGLDPYLWEFGLPKQISVDAGNDQAAIRENLKLGLTSKTIEAQKGGYHRREILRNRVDEILEMVEAAEAIAGKKPQLGFDRAMDLLEQRNPNGTPMPKTGTPATGGSSGKPPPPAPNK